MTLDEHVKNVLGRVRADFKRAGNVETAFECVAEDGELFSILPNWNSTKEKYASFRPLQDTFRRRGVRRYAFMAESWVSKDTDFKGAPCEDPNRTEIVFVCAVERSGSRKAFFAEIKRPGATATLGPWKSEDGGQGWMLELLQEGFSDQQQPAELKPLVPMLDADFLDQNPGVASNMQIGVEIINQLGIIVERELGRFGGNPWAALFPLSNLATGVLAHYLKPKEAAKLLNGFAQVLRDNPDKFSMFGSVKDPEQLPGPGAVEYQPFRDALWDFVWELDGAKIPEIVIVTAVLNLFMNISANVAGTVRTANAFEELGRVIVSEEKEAA